eukprot:CAMPEP_0181215868 /NCGR_PEP_ID=MMETSP1096-20121128/26257_1 /TAXON_ID=156174 ORGANISM="Chrysochromulina ericina, Strain CCMP281" /NCGR_SAMPLE_ID=MMETSP1096 /ASSEMBLY_ACC=CAM_ASM_000453 /LENGTH=62 /DNA_ID=CAMNT_0023307781 /DNA_START=493 /DNA_END=681 /DNA_ORIENTATION=-
MNTGTCKLLASGDASTTASLRTGGRPAHPTFSAASLADRVRMSAVRAESSSIWLRKCCNFCM